MRFSSCLFAWLFVGLFVLGCGRSFEALTPDLDGGVADASVEDASECSSDACGPDAGDAAIEECLPGGWWSAREPLLFDASATVPAVVDHDGSTFFLAFLNGNPSPCDGACPVVMEATFDALSHTLGTSYVMPAYWSDAVTTARLDVRKAGSASSVLLTSVSDAQVAWQWRPLRREGWQNDGSLGLIGSAFEARRVVDVAPLGAPGRVEHASRVAVLHLPSAAGPSGYFDDLQLVAIDDGGATVTYTDLFQNGGVRSPRVVDGTSWVAALQSWHPSATGPLVHLAEVGGSASHHGSSYGCRVEGYDVASTSEGHVAVVQDCATQSVGDRRLIELETHGGVEGLVVVSERRGSVPSSIAMLPSTGSFAEGFVVAFVEEGAESPTLTVVERVEDGLEVRESMRLPIAEGLRLPITALDVVARDDRTILVTWTGTSANPDDLWAWEGPEAAFTIVPRCPCVDGECF